MTVLCEHALWPLAQRVRRRQRLFGAIAGVLLAVALIALADGLQGLMRTDNNELDFVPGECMALSGPAALKNPLASDLFVHFKPEQSPFHFNFDGFFTGYWFGSGMWRGELCCGDGVEGGKFQFSVGFRGVGAQNSQRYELRVYADAQARQQASRSFLRRFLGCNPFIIAAIFGAIGVFAGLITFYFGWQLIHILQSLGLAEIYARQGDLFLCLSPKAMAPGTLCDVLDENGNICGKARVEGWIKGKLRFSQESGGPYPANCLVRIRHPDNG